MRELKAGVKHGIPCAANVAECAFATALPDGRGSDSVFRIGDGTGFGKKTEDRSHWASRRRCMRELKPGEAREKLGMHWAAKVDECAFARIGNGAGLGITETRHARA